MFTPNPLGTAVFGMPVFWHLAGPAARPILVNAAIMAKILDLLNNQISFTVNDTLAKIKPDPAIFARPGRLVC